MIKFDNKVITINNDWLKYDTTPVDPYNPLNLPPYTIRLKYRNGVTPSFTKGTAVQVSSTPNVWDLTYENNSWYYILDNHTDLINVLGANTTGVTNMNDMFNGCSSLTSVPLFNTSNATNMYAMFRSCSSLTSAPLFDTSKVNRMGEMFEGCSSLTSVPLFNTIKVATMGGMFHTCSSLTSVPLFDTSNVTYMGGMFWKCSSLTSAPLFDTSNVTDMSNMFVLCSSLTSVPIFDTSNVTDMSGMFSWCTNVQSGALALYQQASNQTNPPTIYNDCFTDCGSNTQTGLAELQQIPTSWGGLKEE